MNIESIDKLKELKYQLDEITSYGSISYRDRKILIEIIDQIESIIESEDK